MRQCLETKENLGKENVQEPIRKSIVFQLFDHHSDQKRRRAGGPGVHRPYESRLGFRTREGREDKRKVENVQGDEEDQHSQRQRESVNSFRISAELELTNDNRLHERELFVDLVQVMKMASNLDKMEQRYHRRLVQLAKQRFDRSCVS